MIETIFRILWHIVWNIIDAPPTAICSFGIFHIVDTIKVQALEEFKETKSATMNIFRFFFIFFLNHF